MLIAVLHLYLSFNSGYRFLKGTGHLANWSPRNILRQQTCSINMEWVTAWTVLGVVWDSYRIKVVKLWSQLIDKMYKIYSSVLCHVSCPVCCVTTVVNYLRAVGSRFWRGWRKIKKSYFEPLYFKRFRRFNWLINNDNINNNCIFRSFALFDSIYQSPL